MINSSLLITLLRWSFSAVLIISVIACIEEPVETKIRIHNKKSCSALNSTILSAPSKPAHTLFNPRHLNSLFSKVVLNERTVGIVRAYAEFPDYHFVEAQGEGIACVDDAARAAMLFSRLHQINPTPDSLEKSMLLLDFVVAMQAENGFFHNFIYPDSTINTSGATSQAAFNRTSSRSFWALASALHILPSLPSEARKRYVNAITRAKNAIQKHFASRAEHPRIDGDLEAEFLLGYLELYQFEPEESDKAFISILVSDIQSLVSWNDFALWPSGITLSSHSTWHSWGNLSPFALTQAGSLLKDEKLMEETAQMADMFQPFMWSKNIPVTMNLGAKELEMTFYPKLAYDLRPLFESSLSLWKNSCEQRFAERASLWASWFLGNNEHHRAMYDASTGRGYDGLERDGINLNAGAESTIEALSVMLELEQNPVLMQRAHELARGFMITRS